MNPHSIAIAYDCLFPYTTGGGERLYRSYAELLTQRGHEIDYLTSTQWTDAEPAEPFSVIPVTKTLRLYDAKGVRRTPAAVAFAWALFRQLRRRRRKYEAVIVSGLPVLNVFAARAALTGSDTVLIVDYLEVWGRRQWIRYAGTITGTIAWVLQRVAVALTPIATCHSELTARQLRTEGLKGRLLLSPGLIEGRSENEPVLSHTEPPYVLYAGRHIPDKQVDVLPAAVARAREVIPDLRLVVLGSGSSTPELLERIAEVSAEKWADVPGFVSQERLDDLMAHAACLVNPSRREGYGLVVVEASAHGTPVVLVDHAENAATELISPGVNGFVAESSAADDLAAGIIAAVHGGDTLRAATRAWYEDAVTTRTVERTVDGIIGAIDHEIESREARRGKKEEGHS